MDFRRVIKMIKKYLISLFSLVFILTYTAEARDNNFILKIQKNLEKIRKFRSNSINFIRKKELQKVKVKPLKKDVEEKAKVKILNSNKKVQAISLIQAIKIALKNNPLIFSVKAKLQNANFKLKEARANFSPDLTLTQISTHLNEPPTMNLPSGIFGPYPLSAPLGKENIFNTKLTLKQPIYNGGAINTGINIADLNLKLTRYNYQKQEQKIIFDCINAYINVLKAKEFVKISKKAVSQVKAHLKNAIAFFKAGKVVKSDILRAEVQLATVKENLIKAKNGYKLAKTVLNSVMGIDLNKKIKLLCLKKIQNSNLPYKDYLKLAFKNRLELKEIEIAKKIQKQQLNLALSSKRPKINFLSNYNWKKGDQLPEDMRDSWDASLIISFNIFDGKKSNYKEKQIKASLNQLKADELKLKQGISLQIKQAFLKLKEAKERIKVTNKSVKQAEENLRIVEKQYQAGVSSSIDVIDAQVCKTSAKIKAITALYDHILAKVKLFYQMGLIKQLNLII